MLDAIQTFLAVATEGSFTAVARQQDTAVSSITRKIDTLEADLGVKLLARSSRAIRLTDAGEEFLPRARRMLAEMDDARHVLADLNADPSGLLSVTVPAAFGRRHVVPALPTFLAKYPLMEIEMHVSDQRVDLTTQRADVAIRIGVLPDSDLVATRLAPQRRLACASPAYLERHGAPAGPQELLTHNCLNYASTPIPTGWWNFPELRRTTALPVRGSFKTDDTETLLEAAIAGIGIVHLASWLVCDALRDGRLVSLFPDSSPAAASSGLSPNSKGGNAEIHAVRLPGRSHTAKAQLFIAHLKEHIGNPPYWDLPELGPAG
ncbi:transcriptional regulator [Hylemonella gracilis str. Niagara R]|uniref:Transcriptional regulator n=1 Tax=Hylemonella gracilis str. Niagara R TaxID=1458275 RepID=A0A016XD67_9BURK|nr:LysR family transcriptional regulator [Hylemonella gracilis]EYC49776.1 transcriptional regulator [Hylemonella gracilis str. Niagara R]